MKAPETKVAPVRRRAFYPASSPGLKFITFNGPKLSATNASAGVPAALSSRGMGGLTLGTGATKLDTMATYDPISKYYYLFSASYSNSSDRWKRHVCIP